MSAGERPIIEHIKEHKKTWRELWLSMADGDIVKYNEIKRMDALGEFWTYYDHWKQKQEQILDEYKRNKRQK